MAKLTTKEFKEKFNGDLEALKRSDYGLDVKPTKANKKRIQATYESKKVVLRDNHVEEKYLKDSIVIGIDTGVKTGIGIVQNGRLIKVASMKAIEAEVLVLTYKSQIKLIRIEDARLMRMNNPKAKTFGDVNRLQGVGSVKRDSHRWEEFCTYHNFKYELVNPLHNERKTKADYFNAVTGWKKLSNEHARDATMLIRKYIKYYE